MKLRKVILAAALAAAFAGCEAESAAINKETAVPVSAVTAKPAPTPEPTPEPTPAGPEWLEYMGDLETYTDLYEQLQEAKKINPDMVAWVYFPSGLVSQPVAQGNDNAFYLRHDWKTGAPLDWGSIYMDFRNDLDKNDKNTLLYGNYVYTTYSSDRSLVFTPLAQLRKQENYEPNKYVSLITDKEVRFYELAHVFDVPTVYVEAGQIPAPGYEFNEIDFTPEKQLDLINNIKKIEFYPTDVEITGDDTLFMMQTCVENHTEVRQINVCKELGRIDIPEKK